MIVRKKLPEVPNVDPHRSQFDGLQQVFSDATAVDFRGEEGLARQEFKDEADINVIVRRFGSFAAEPWNVGERDYTLDMQGGFMAAREAQSAFRRLPEDIRARFGSWDALLAAVDSGDFAFPTPAGGAGAEGAGAAGGAASPPQGGAAAGGGSAPASGGGSSS